MINGKIQNNANLIWSIADVLTGAYKPHEYGKVILPLTVIKRFDCILEPTHDQVLEKLSKNTSMSPSNLDVLLKRTTKHQFYNTSKYTFKSLLDDAPNLKANLIQYLDSFSPEVQGILKYYEFNAQIEKMANPDNGNILFAVLEKINDSKIELHPDKISNIEMGYIFEELIRRFSESYAEEAGQHYTPREVIKLMVNLLFTDDDEILSGDSKIKTIYDPACGTGGMLTVATETLAELNSSSRLELFGQELNEETVAIAKSDVLIKGFKSENIRHGNTLSNDTFKGSSFDYIISNPPFGREWKKEKDAVAEEYKDGFAGRFGIYNAFNTGKGDKFPDVSDSQTLFLTTAISKMKDIKDGGSRIAIIHNGSPLFSGDAGSAISNLRRYLFENDLIEAIIQLPNDIFYNTGITVYIWILSNKKPLNRKGKVQLIDASSYYEKLRKNLGNKRVEISEDQIEEITKIFAEFKPSDLSKIFDNIDFGYTKVSINQPVRDENGDILKNKKGVPEIDKDKSDTENIPLTRDIEEYFENEILPYAQDAWLDRTKDVIGYEIPFTRHFYKFVPPRDSSAIFAEIKELEKEEELLVKELFGNE
ncbi:MAG: class I SAM-dependent DNA methyltransferase [Acholeplasmataceae bacterium]|jgi:type I restriction enzyme M protein|nr:class I SAM-dependent DNA methyltransferase [Acholeplasmataceae bacterium]